MIGKYTELFEEVDNMGVWQEVFSILLKLVCAVITALMGGIVLPWIKTDMIPWLQEKRLMKLTSVFVQAAHKLAESGAIKKEAKLRYVMSMLEAKGIKIDEEKRAFIESAVIDLDKALSEAGQSVVEVLVKADDDTTIEEVTTEE